MIRIATFSPADADEAGEGEMRRHLRAMALTGSSFTIRDEARQLLLIAGIMPNHGFAATAWATVMPGCWGHMSRITRAIADYLDTLAYRRIDMMVRADFAPGHRWAKRLGFDREAVLRCWAPDGSDMVVHARIKGDVNG